MGLKGDMLWVIGQLDSNVQSPHHAPHAHPHRVRLDDLDAVQLVRALVVSVA
jgi:hypothetical protein